MSWFGEPLVQEITPLVLITASKTTRDEPRTQPLAQADPRSGPRAHLSHSIVLRLGINLSIQRLNGLFESGINEV